MRVFKMIRSCLILLLVLSVSHNTAWAQEVKYDQSLRLEQTPPALGSLNQCPINHYSYSGEFQIYNLNIAIGEFRDLMGYNGTDGIKAYKYEVVSFPFLADKDASAARSARVLTIPPDNKRGYTIYDLDTNNTISRPSWDFITYHDPNYMPPGSGIPVFQEYKQFAGDFRAANNVSLIEAGPLGVVTMVLHSKLFGLASFPAEIQDVEHRIVLPHTTLKLTLYFDKNSTSLVDDTDPMYRPDESISVILDLTRGRVSEYPFNTTGSSVLEEHDITVVVNIRDNGGYGYNGNTQKSERILNYSSLDPIDIIKGIGYPTWEENAYVADYFIGNCDGSVPAGYNQGGKPHSYLIDKPIDLTNINPSERIIYNPAEAEITTDLVDPIVFPECYTFRSIGGVYPEFDAALLNDPQYKSQLPYVADHIAENGAPYRDLREIPIKSTVATDDVNADGTIDHYDAGVYVVKPNSAVWLENGVTIYDATFVIEETASLLGNLDEVFGRFKIIYKDANGNITSSQEINHGRKEIAASTAPVGGGIIQLPGGAQLANGQTHFEVNERYVARGPYIEAAGNGYTALLKDESVTKLYTFNDIDLYPGFDTEFGAELFAEIVAETDGCVVIPQSQGGGGGEGSSGEGGQGSSKRDITEPADDFVIELFPNPANDLLTVESSHTLSTIVIADATGKALREYKVEGSESTIDISGFPAGYYLVRMESINEAFEWKPLIIE